MKPTGVGGKGKSQALHKTALIYSASRVQLYQSIRWNPSSYFQKEKSVDRMRFNTENYSINKNHKHQKNVDPKDCQGRPNDRMKRLCPRSHKHISNWLPGQESHFSPLCPLPLTSILPLRSAPCWTSSTAQSLGQSVSGKGKEGRNDPDCLGMSPVSTAYLNK